LGVLANTGFSNGENVVYM